MRSPQIIAHLDAETAYCKAALADTEALQEQLYTEMRGRIQVRIALEYASVFNSMHLGITHVIAPHPLNRNFN